MADKTFTATIDEWVGRTEEMMLAVVKDSLQDVIDEMQTPTSKGGRMRVDTGFLRASGRASNSGWPSGASIRPKDALPNSFAWDGNAVTTVINSLDFDDTFYFGWTAGYAATREVFDGFLDAAMQNWQSHVNRNIERAKE